MFTLQTDILVREIFSVIKSLPLYQNLNLIAILVTAGLVKFGSRSFLLGEFF